MLLFLTTKSASEFLSENNVSNVFLLGFSFSFSFFLCNGDRRLDVENISPIVFQKHPSLFFPVVLVGPENAYHIILT